MVWVLNTWHQHQAETTYIELVETYAVSGFKNLTLTHEQQEIH